MKCLATLRIHLLSAETGRRRSDLPCLATSASHNALVHCRFDAIVHFQVKLRELVLLVRGGLLDVSKRGGVHDVPDDESLNGLIFGDGLPGRHAANPLDVTAPLLVAPVIASFHCHRLSSAPMNGGAKCECALGRIGVALSVER
jgi:hypothetical protein